MIWGGETADQVGKGIAASGGRKSRDLGWGNHGPGGKRDHGLRGLKVT